MSGQSRVKPTPAVPATVDVEALNVHTAPAFNFRNGAALRTDLGDVRAAHV
jgi:hypothetical protein